MLRYWEKEEPIIKNSFKNVVKIYRKTGKIQVFPKVEKSKHGIGRGATLDLESFPTYELIALKALIDMTIENQVNMRKDGM